MLLHAKNNKKKNIFQIPVYVYVCECVMCETSETEMRHDFVYINKWEIIIVEFYDNYKTFFVNCFA